MYIDLEGQSYTVDLLPHVREYSKPTRTTTTTTMAFTIPCPKAGQRGVDIRKWTAAWTST